MEWIHVLMICFVYSTGLTASGGTVHKGDSDNGEEMVQSFCGGIETELSDCNDRMVELTKYKCNIEKDLFTLKGILRDTRLSCRNVGLQSLKQITALQNQLELISKKLGEQAPGPATDVLNILLKYVNAKKLELNLLMETELENIPNLEEHLQMVRNELDEMVNNLNLKGSECPTTNNSQILDIMELQDQIDKLRGNSGAEGLITELELRLLEKRRHLEDSGDTTSAMIKQFMDLQGQIMDVQKNLTNLMEAEVQLQSLQGELQEKLRLLSELKEQRSDPQIKPQISRLEEEQQELQHQSSSLQFILSLKPALLKDLEEMKKQMKNLLDGLKNNQDLISQVLFLKLQLIQNQIQSKGDQIMMETNLSDLQTQLRLKSRRMDEALSRSQYLEWKLNTTEAECNNHQIMNNASEKQVTDLQQEVRDKQEELEQCKTNSETHIRELREQMQQKEKEVSNLTKSNTELKKEVDGKQRELAEVQQEVRNKEQEVKDKNTTISTMKQKLRDKNQESEREKKTCTELQKDSDKKIKDLQQAVKDKEQEAKENDAIIAKIKQELRDKEREVELQRRVSTELLNENKRLQDLVTMLNRTMELGKKPRKVEVKPTTVAVTIEDQRIKQPEQKALKEKEEEPITVVFPALDPQTAHRRLKLSDNGRTARVTDLVQPVPDNPERFDTPIAALAETGYSSGRIYWEVQVGERLCFVMGVASESVQRKGETFYSPRKGYWVIRRRNDGMYHALTNRPTMLQLTDELSVVGVLVNFKKGEVMFYNVGSRSLIYKYSGINFPKTLLPFIATCADQDEQDEPIRILQARSITWIN